MDLLLNATFLIIAITFLISYLAWQPKSNLWDKLIFHPYSMHRNKATLGKFIGAGFLHADWQHLIFNMLSLFFFGSRVENTIGTPLFILLYLLAFVASGLPDYLKHKNNYNYSAVGASGAVSAVVFAAILIDPWMKIYLKFLIPIPAILYGISYIAYSIYMDKQQQDNIGHGAHLWGAVFGFLFLALIRIDLLQKFISNLINFY
jgi:membrane associated rhomboid family serine protease